MSVQAMQSNIDRITGALGRLCLTLEDHTKRLTHLESRGNDQTSQQFRELIRVHQKMNANLEKIVFGMSVSKKQPFNADDGSSSTDLQDQVYRPPEILMLQSPSNVLEQPPIRNMTYFMKKGSMRSQNPRCQIVNSMAWKEEQMNTLLLERRFSKEVLYKIFQEFVSGGTEQLEPNSLVQFHRYIGQFYSRTARYYYELYSSASIDYDDLKVRFSTDIINKLIELQGEWSQYILKLSYEDISKSHRKGKMFYQLFNQSSVQSLRFLIHKYPPSRTYLIDTELSQKIQEMKTYSVVKYDLLKNAEIEIGMIQGQTDFSREIKTWLNKLTFQTKKQYPVFKQTMKSIFSGTEGSLDGNNRDSDLQYAISSKIPQNTQLYSEEEIDAPGLTVKNPEMLRVLIKWYQELIVYFTNPQEKIICNKFGFKSTHAKSIPIRIPESKLQQLAHNLTQLYEQDIKQIEKKEHFNIGVFIEGLISISMGGIDGYDFVNGKEITISKMSQCLYQFFKSNLLIFLNLCLQKLVEVRAKYTVDALQSNIQLITFGIMDILRCRCVGSKQEIYRIYHEITRNSDYFQIIRVKNKLNESTKDILINLKLKKSFLICEVQLALGTTKKQVSDHFCHYLYQLQRSKFGVIFQCASQIYNLDPKIEYVKKHPQINFKKRESMRNKLRQVIRVTDILECRNCHPLAKMFPTPNIQPFVCLYCMSFIPAYSNKLPSYNCRVCSFTICQVCSVSLSTKSDELMKCIFKIEIPAKELLIPRFHYGQYLYPGCHTRKEIQTQLSEQVQKHKYVLLAVVDNNRFNYGVFKKYKGSVTQTFSTVPEIPQMSFNSSAPKVISTIIPLRPPSVMKIQQLTQLRKIHLIYMWCKLQSVLYERDIDTVVCIVCEEKRLVWVIDVLETEQKISWCKLRRAAINNVEDCNRVKGSCLQITSKKLQSLSFLRDLKHKDSITTLNLLENQIQDISILRQFNNIEELYLDDNKVQSLDPLLHMAKLQILSVGGNGLEGSLPRLCFPQLQYLTIENNKLTDIINIPKSNMKSLMLLKLSRTLIRKLPRMDFPKLQFIKADNCRINDLTEFAQSNLPSLNKLNLEENQLCGQMPTLNLPMLVTLKLCDNGITSLCLFVRSNLSSLSTLLVSRNKIQGKLDAIQFKELTQLDMSYNQISYINDFIFTADRFPKLSSISLRHNKLQNTIPGMKLPSLLKLDLGENNISIFKTFNMNQSPLLQEILFDHNKIDHMLTTRKHNNIKLIDLSYNQISNIENLHDWRVPLLSTLKLNNNNISCPIPKLSMSSLQHLDLSHNEIVSEQLIEGLHLIPKIASINLCDNPPQLQQGIVSRNQPQDIKCIFFS